MAGFAKVTILGNLGADPEVRNTPSGAQVANFRVACTETWKDASGQRQERTEWVTVVAWKGLADIAGKYLRKGSKVYVEGKLQTRQWDDKNGGGKRSATEVLCDNFIMLDGRPGGEAGGGEGGAPAARAGRPARSTGMGAAAGPEDFGDYVPPGNATHSQEEDLPF
jgi:single-strand DNA-binding protein